MLTDGVAELRDIRKYSLFHGTDFNCAKAICESAFIVKPSDEHWLGNGIYFYLDDSLAKWWTTNPTNKFGTRISTPAIIKCDLEIDRENLFDLTRLEDYRDYVQLVDEFLLGPMRIRPPDSGYSLRKLRCLFFDWLFERYEIYAITGNFYLPRQPYLPEFEDPRTPEFNLRYTETQICVKTDAQHLIISKTILQ